MLGRGAGGDGAFQGGDFLEEFLFLGDEVGYVAALAGVEGLVGVWCGGQGGGGGCGEVG